MDRDEWRVAALRTVLLAYIDASRRAEEMRAQHDRDAAVLDAARLRGAAWLLTNQAEPEPIKS